MRLQTKLGAVALVAAAGVAAAGCGSPSAGGTSVSGGASHAMRTTSAPMAHHRPSVRLQCIHSPNANEPCGATANRKRSNGWYVAIGHHIPANTPYVVTVREPNGQKYPFDQYTSPGVLYGIRGDVHAASPQGLLSWNIDQPGTNYGFRWAATNGRGVSTDKPSNKEPYRLTIHIKIAGVLYAFRFRAWEKVIR